MEIKITPAQRTLLRSIQKAGGSVKIDQMTHREEGHARKLSDAGLLKIAENEATTIAPWELSDDQKAASAGKVNDLIDFSARGDDWKRPRKNSAGKPTLCVSMPLPIYERLREAGPGKIRSVLSQIARIGHDAATLTLGNIQRETLTGGNKVYGVGIDPDLAEKVKGGALTKQTGAALRIAAEIGIDRTLEILSSAE